jgi:hypothetical protein
MKTPATMMGGHSGAEVTISRRSTSDDRQEWRTKKPRCSAGLFSKVEELFHR